MVGIYFLSFYGRYLVCMAGLICSLYVKKIRNLVFMVGILFVCASSIVYGRCVVCMVSITFSSYGGYLLYM